MDLLMLHDIFNTVPVTTTKGDKELLQVRKQETYLLKYMNFSFILKEGSEVRHMICMKNNSKLLEKLSHIMDARRKVFTMWTF